MRNEVMWAIRDARGLMHDEKALLWAIESRGTAVAKWDTLAADAGMGKDRFYRTRHSLSEKELIRVVRKHNGVSEYTVDSEALAHSHSANETPNDSQGANSHSHSANEELHMNETKKNTKKKEKKKMKDKEEQTAASAPVVPLDETKEGSPSSPLDAEPDATVLEVEQDADSHSANKPKQTSREMVEEVRSGKTPWKARTLHQEPEEVLEEAW